MRVLFIWTRHFAVEKSAVDGIDYGNRRALFLEWRRGNEFKVREREREDWGSLEM